GSVAEFVRLRIVPNSHEFGYGQSIELPPAGARLAAPMTAGEAGDRSGRRQQQQQRRRLRHGGHENKPRWAVEPLAVDEGGVDGRAGNGVVFAHHVWIKVGHEQVVVAVQRQPVWVLKRRTDDEGGGEDGSGGG